MFELFVFQIPHLINELINPAFYGRVALRNHLIGKYLPWDRVTTASGKRAWTAAPFNSFWKIGSGNEGYDRICEMLYV